MGRPWDDDERADAHPGRARAGRARRPARHPVRVGGRAPLPRGVQPLLGAGGVPRRLQPAHDADPPRPRDHPHRPAVQPSGADRRAGVDARPRLQRPRRVRQRRVVERGRARRLQDRPAAQARRVARGPRDHDPVHGRDAVHRRRRRVRADAAAQRRAQAGPETAPAAVGGVQPARDDPPRRREGHRRADVRVHRPRRGAHVGARVRADARREVRAGRSRRQPAGGLRVADDAPPRRGRSDPPWCRGRQLLRLQPRPLLRVRHPPARRHERVGRVRASAAARKASIRRPSPGP